MITRGSMIKNPVKSLHDPEGAFSIVPFQASHVNDLAAIWMDASTLVHAFLGEERLSKQKELVKTIYFPKSEVWVALRNGQCIGFIGLIDSFVGALFVAPKAQGRGVGRALVEKAQILKENLALEVYAANTGAHTFYKSLGFVEVYRRDTDDEGLPFELIHMGL